MRVICLAIVIGCVCAFSPHSTKCFRKNSLRMANDDFANSFKIAAATVATALTLQGGLLQPLEAVAAPPAFTSNVVAEKVVKQGVYKTYEADLYQEVDDAASTFKSTKETKSKKGKYTALITILVVGSFIIPMTQYFWYVREDDSFENFFKKDEPPPPPPPPTKKKKRFGR